jgi:hypothetical protein
MQCQWYWWRRATALLVVSCSVSGSAWAGECGFRLAFERADENGTEKVKVYQGKAIRTLGNVRPLLFITSLKVNTDGAKISYHEHDITGRRCATDPNKAPCAINNIRNAYRDHKNPESDFTEVRDAGYPEDRTWQVLNPKIIEKNAKDGKPCRTPDGYLVSMTARRGSDIGKEGDCNQEKWIDAMNVPAIVIPGNSEFSSHGVRVQSVIVAVSKSSSKRVVPGIVGDTGPEKEIGEATIAMNRTLNGLPATDVPKHRQDAIDRFQAGPTAILLFPGDQNVLARPLTAARAAKAGNDALAKFGGAAKLYACIKEEIDSNF